MSKPVGIRLNDDVLRSIDTLVSELDINRSKAVLLLIDVALGTHDMNMIKNHYLNMKDILFIHGNVKNKG